MVVVSLQRRPHWSPESKHGVGTRKELWRQQKVCPGLGHHTVRCICIIYSVQQHPIMSGVLAHFTDVALQAQGGDKTHPRSPCSERPSWGSY